MKKTFCEWLYYLISCACCFQKETEKRHETSPLSPHTIQMVQRQSSQELPQTLSTQSTIIQVRVDSSAEMSLLAAKQSPKSAPSKLVPSMAASLSQADGDKLTNYVKDQYTELVVDDEQHAEIMAGASIIIDNYKQKKV